MKVTFTCPNCEKHTVVTIYPFRPATWTSPAEGGDYEPDSCDHCNCPITKDNVNELARKAYEDSVDAKEDAWEQRLAFVRGEEH